MVTPEMKVVSDIPPRVASLPTDPNAKPGDVVFAESWGVVPHSVYAPEMYPNYHLAANFGLYERVLDHLMPSFPTTPLNQLSTKSIEKTSRSPMEVSRSVLYAIVMLYLRSGFYGRVNDMNIESIYLDNKAQFAVFEAQSSELAVISLIHLKEEEKTAFWLNVYHTMLLHALVYMKHRPYLEHKQLMDMYKKVSYKIDGLEYTIFEVLVGMLRGGFGKDDSLGGSVVFPQTNPKSKFVCKEKDEMIGFLISFGLTTSPPIWIYDASDFKAQEQKAINHFLGAQCVAIGANKNMFVPQTMKMYVKDFKNEKTMFKMLLKQFKIEESGWSLKWQNVERECGVWLDQLSSEGVTVTHREVPYLAQFNLFPLSTPEVKVKTN
ncbi:hypothetical protein EIN_373750 [Entamoeba invadens IP1]|uniref:DUF547 domain-containing protein n=1 Tax=Entamoeba invadens IP1 TaxID=370355 RepID=A0A0A1TU30_ENTIV|nr:hypothetical protein EIN_373750 [Entamoeba invadens IP1]ELP83400.1 hypothetical protein EIN_373750 [Entamoeba invadens IP1]|eukprot:XP_004182746.1 hypothetical protein EIN_373750 [Entamoeba invadens IP1]